MSIRLFKATLTVYLPDPPESGTVFIPDVIDRAKTRGFSLGFYEVEEVTNPIEHAKVVEQLLLKFGGTDNIPGWKP